MKIINVFVVLSIKLSATCERRHASTKFQLTVIVKSKSHTRASCTNISTKFVAQKIKNHSVEVGNNKSISGQIVKVISKCAIAIGRAPHFMSHSGCDVTRKFYDLRIKANANDFASRNKKIFIFAFSSIITDKSLSSK